jgi:two-component system alkaline phosphatase synthesis response regulator PhoP
MELLARLEALLRRASEHQREVSPEGVFRFGSIQVNFRATQVLRDGNPLELSAREFKLLRYFIEHRGTTLCRDDLLNGVWGYEAMPFTRTVDVHVASLRQKVEPNPRHPQFILTVHGLGYRFVA